jgi:mannose/cellobiose epimerase-like protein (N-acyl-D-glucosamine 2-epimerase family)
MKRLTLAFCLAASAAAAADPLPRRAVNANATPEAQRLLDFLYEVQGRRIVSGQHNFIMSGSRFTDRVRELTGKTPLVWGSDFSFAYQGETPKSFQHCGPLNLTEPGTPVEVTGLTPELARERLVKNAIQASRDGHVVTLMWHACPPGLGDACDGNAIWTLEKRPSQEWWDELTTDGTKLNTAWKAQVDVIAGYLKQLKDARVPVLWRPYHEMNGVWFWWCNKKGPNGFRKLWLMMYERYVKVHHLDNLIWVWNTNAPRDKKNDEAFPYEEFWPGREVVDVLAADVYWDDWKPSHHDDLLKLAQGKPIAIGELAPPPTLETLAAQPRWAWFMPWGNLAFWGNGPERLKALLASERVLGREQVKRGDDGTWRILPAGAAPSAAERIYTKAQAKALLERLLLENILPFWYPATIDEEHGGYRLNHDDSGRWLGPADKAIVTQARTVWFFSRLYNSPYGKPEHLEAARHGFRFLRDRMWDRENGGFYWSVTSDGSRPVEDQKHMYGQGFGLYALAEYVKASRDPEATALAKQLFGLMETKAHDDRHGGYLELFPRDWSRDPAKQPRVRASMGSDQPFGRKLMNTHLHLMEPFTTYYEVTRDEQVKKRLVELILVQSNAVVRKGLGACSDRYERDWTPLATPRDQRVSYGHDIENVWLLIVANQAAGLPNGPLTDLYKALFAYSLEYGWDREKGGLFYNGPFRQPADMRGKSWWVQAETMASGLHMYRLTGDEKYYEVFEKTLRFIDLEQADWKNGDWHAWVGAPQELKAGPWKGPYHNGRAVLECLQLLEAAD